MKFVKTRLFEPSLHQAFPGFYPHSVFPFICARGTEVWIIISDLLTDGTRRQTAAISSSHLISPSIFFFHLASSNATEFQGSVKLGLIEGSMFLFVFLWVKQTRRQRQKRCPTAGKKQTKKLFRWGQLRPPWLEESPAQPGAGWNAKVGVVIHGLIHDGLDNDKNK